MIETVRVRDNLEKLLKIARGDTDALRSDLADIEKARQNTEISLANLEQAAKAEEASVAQSPAADLAAYLEGVRARRHNLRTTLLTLREAEEKARDRLKVSFVEIKKLEHLIEMQKREISKAERRRETLEIDDIAGLRSRKA